jgi:hypothetical protein
VSRSWLAIAAVLIAGTAGAHPRATSLSAWELGAGAEGFEASLTLRVPWNSLQAVLPELAGEVPEALAWRPELARLVDGYLREHARLRAGGADCAPRGVALAVSSVDPTHLARRFRLACPPAQASAGAERLQVEVDLFQEVDASHLHLARVRLPDGRELDRVMVMGQSVWRPAAPAGREAAASSLGDYLLLGVEHIATGYDHLVFVLALLLAGSGVAQLATVVTGFTVAHSVTLALGVLGWVTPLPAAVEALIGFSIVVVACENFALTLGLAARRGVLAALAAFVAAAVAACVGGLVALPALAVFGIGLFSLCYLALAESARRPERLRWFVALVFGLVHGFGFAGVLVEAGLPRENAAAALLGFNLGVEVGQLAVVAVGWTLLRGVLTGPAERRLAAIQWGSTPVLAAGLYWFLSRALAR